MSKITQALKKASEEKSHIVSPVKESNKFTGKQGIGGHMRKSWLTWGFIVAIVTVFVVFNYQEGKDAVPLSEIFPDEEVFPIDVEYEFVQEEVVSSEPEAVAAITREPVVALAPKKAEVREEIVFKSLPVIEKNPVYELSAYTIQIASFKDKKRAEEALVKIRTKVPSAYIASRDLGSKGVWYRIYAGQYNARNDAEVSLSNIKQNYDGSFIISPKRTK